MDEGLTILDIQHLGVKPEGVYIQGPLVAFESTVPGLSYLTIFSNYTWYNVMHALCQCMASDYTTSHAVHRSSCYICHGIHDASSCIKYYIINWKVNHTVYYKKQNYSLDQ